MGDSKSGGGGAGGGLLAGASLEAKVEAADNFKSAFKSVQQVINSSEGGVGSSQLVKQASAGLASNPSVDQSVKNQANKISNSFKDVYNPTKSEFKTANKEGKKLLTSVVKKYGTHVEKYSSVAGVGKKDYISKVKNTGKGAKLTVVRTGPDKGNVRQELNNQVTRPKS